MTDKISNFKVISKNKRNRRKTKEELYIELKQIAESNGGKLLSPQWTGYKNPHEFEYSDGRKFETSYQNIKQNSWPKFLDVFFRLSEAQNKKNSDFLSEMKLYAIKNEGVLLSKEWFGSRYKYEFADKEGTVFKCSYRGLKSGQWLPDRGLISEPICRQAIEHLFQTQFIKTNKVLSAKIINRKYPFELDGYSKELKIAFEYQGDPSHYDPKYLKYQIVSKRDEFKKEKCAELGIILISIPKFEKNRDKFNEDKIIKHVVTAINKTYFSLGKELPLLNKENFKLNISEIHHAKQMYKNLKAKDAINNIKIINPEWLGTNEKHIFEFSNGQEFHMTPTNIQQVGFPKNSKQYFKNRDAKNKNNFELLKELKVLANENEFELVSKIWLGSKNEYTFKDKNDNIINLSHDKLKSRGWPKDINHFLKKRGSHMKTNEEKLFELKEFVQNGSGKLISQEWLGIHEKHVFEFSDGRQFVKAPHELYKTGWPKDADEFFKRSNSYAKTNEELLGDLEDICIINKGLLISKEWLGNTVNHEFQFESGRLFQVTPHYIKHKGWPIDSYIKEKKLEEISNKKIQIIDERLEVFRKIAEANGGKLLTTEWLGGNAKYKFEFADGREFERDAKKIRKADGWPKNPDKYFKIINALSQTDEQKIEEMQNLAKQNGGEFISKEWIGANEKHTFKYKDGREFEISPSFLKMKGWPQDLDIYFINREKYLPTAKKKM